MNKDSKLIQLYSAISTVGELQAQYTRNATSARTVIVLLFYVFVKMLKDSSMARSNAGKYNSTMVELYNNILATYQYSHKYRTISSVPKSIDKCPKFFNWCTMELVHHCATGMKWLDKSLPSEHATFARELRRITKLCNNNTSVLLDAFTNMPTGVSDLVDQIIKNPSKANDLILQHSKVGGVLHNYRAMAILEDHARTVAVPKKEEPKKETSAEIQMTKAQSELIVALQQLAKRDSRLYKKVLDRIKKEITTAK